MGIFLLIYPFFPAPYSCRAVLVAVIIGVGIYIFVLFKLDREIHEELRKSECQSRSSMARVAINEERI